MDAYFCLKCKDEDGVLRYLDIPGSQCQQGVQLIGYKYLHGGDNQQWKWQDEQLISLMLAPSFSVSVNQIRNGSPVILHSSDHETDGDTTYHTKWILENGVIKLKVDRNFCIGSSNSKIVLRNISASTATQWETQICDTAAKPATSCHLTYRPLPKVSGFDSWTLENTVCVRESSNSTYFCIVGWGPGGYSGIQQINEDRRVVIFSMWNHCEDNVKMLKCGDGVIVSEFGGEGTGMKAMKDVPWKNNEKVSFRVTGSKYINEDSISGWRCSGWYSIEGTGWVLMASYERCGEELPFDQHFYAFVEDWDRNCDSEGHKFMRMAEFSDAKAIMSNGDQINFNKAVFTKQRHGADKYGMDKAFGGVKKSSSSFLLSTGGSTCTSVQQYCLEKYEDCTNNHGKQLLL